MILEYSTSPWRAITPELLNHLWQSTVFATVAGLLALMLRKNHAQTRYWVWLAASIKFLVPFSLLAGAASRLSWWQRPPTPDTGFYVVIEQAGRPFTQSAAPAAASATFSSGLFHLLPALLAAVWMVGFAVVLAVWLARWLRITLAIKRAEPLRAGREVETLRRMERAGKIRKTIEIFLSSASLEPGIVGIARPVLIWPAGISDRLDDAHLEAVLAHEVWHVRRHDNLAAAIHMFVEAVFWFHPLVWWLGARLVEERERACDEEVLLLGSAPQVYAESILKVCEFCVGSPLACISGVTGADLKKRIVHIMTRNVVRKLDFSRKLLLSVAAVLTLAIPVVFGLAKPGPGSAQPLAANPAESATVFSHGYQNVSITPGETGNGAIQTRIMFTPEGLMAKNQTLKDLLRLAYGVQDNQITGGPEWLASARFNLEARLDSATTAELNRLSPEQKKIEREQIFQALLADQFKVALHRESKPMQAYVLAIAKNGPKVQPAKPGDTYPNGIQGRDGQPAGPHRFDMSLNEFTIQAMPMTFVANQLAAHLNQPVVDRTGLTGDYDFTLKWTHEGGVTDHKEMHGGSEATVHTAEVGATNTALFTAMEEQLGLKLDQQTVPLPVLVVDRAEKPSAN